MASESKNGAHCQREAEYLIRLYQENHSYSREILAALVRLFYPFFKYWAAKYRSKYYKYRPDIPAKDYEAVSIGCLPRAARNYDFSAKTRFSTYLSAWVKHACRNYANENGDFLKVFKKRKRRSKSASNLNDEQSAEQTTSPNVKQQKDDSDENAAVYAIPFEDLTTRDYAAYDAECFYRMNRRQEIHRKMDQVDKLLADMHKSSLAVLRKQADRIVAFKEHVLMGGSKKSFCDVTGISRSTLDMSLIAVRERLLHE